MKKEKMKSTKPPAKKKEKEEAPPLTTMERRLHEMHRKCSTVAGGLAFSIYKRTFSPTSAKEWISLLNEVSIELKGMVK